MSNCVICEREIPTNTKTVSAVGGLFPREEPDFFMVDETVMKESHMHLDCLLAAFRSNREVSRSEG